MEVEEPPAKKKKGDKGYPPGIFGEPGKLQARLPGFKVDGKVCQKPIPKTYKDGCGGGTCSSGRGASEIGCRWPRGRLA